MKNTRAFIISFKKIVLLFFLLVSFLESLSLIIINKNMLENKIIDYSLSSDCIKNEFVFGNTGNKEKTTVGFLQILSLLLNEDVKEPLNIFINNISFVNSLKEIKNQYAIISESNNYYIPKIINKLIDDTKKDAVIYNDVTETTIHSVKKNGTVLEKTGLTLDNKTSYDITVESVMSKKINITAPHILIVHTHGSESYNPTDRNEDTDKNVVRVGKEMAEIFKQNGIKVTHSTKMHDIPKFNNSYKNSLATVSEMMKKYPDINVVLDIHRDAMITENGEVYKVVKDINGQKMAQVMFVVGSDNGGLEHPFWKDNLNFAFLCQKRINELAPDLARPVNIRKERFNQHTTRASLIVEVGTNGNTLDEAINSALITAQAISDVLNSLK